MQYNLNMTKELTEKKSVSSFLLHDEILLLNPYQKPDRFSDNADADIVFTVHRTIAYARGKENPGKPFVSGFPGIVVLSLLFVYCHFTTI